MEEKIFGVKLLMVSIETSEVLIIRLFLLEKLGLITNEECIESNIIPVEAMKFLEEETPMESINQGATTNEQDGEDEDLVCREKKDFFRIIFEIYFSLI